MKLFVGILLLFLFLGFKGKDPVVQAQWEIPQQTFNPFAEMGMTRAKDTLTVEEFTITKQVTLGEYRNYLDAVKRDSSDAYYRSQLPDSTMCTASAYRKYMEPGKYDRFPVCGVSWVNALNYCRWKAKQDHLPDSVEYRLPFLEDWVAAYRHLRAQKLPHDFNQNYSDWLMNVMDESAYDFYGQMDFSYHYPDNPNDPPVLRRKRFIGNSFHFQHEHLAAFASEYGYSFRGYAYVSFRMIKVPVTRKSPKLFSSKWKAKRKK